MAWRPDKTDLRIIELLLADGGLSKAELGRQVGLAPSAVFARVKRLEAEGVLKGASARVDAAALGFELLAFVYIGEVKPSGGFDLGAALATVTGVEEVHRIAGEDCFLVKLRARNTRELSEILSNEINQLKTVARVNSTIALATIREDPPLSGRKLS